MIAVILIQRMVFLRLVLQALKIVDLVRVSSRKVVEGQLRRCR